MISRIQTNRDFRAKFFYVPAFDFAEIVDVAMLLCDLKFIEIFHKKIRIVKFNKFLLNEYNISIRSSFKNIVLMEFYRICCLVSMILYSIKENKF